MERILLAASTFCYLLGFAWTLIAIGAGKFRPARFNFVAISAGFVFQTWFLHLRGQEIGRCPITSLFEVMIFLSWSIGLIYMIVGSAYRISLMGAFTAPLIFLIQGFAMVALDPAVSVSRISGPANPWLEFHAAFSIIAYGAFALAGVAGLMYIVQDRQLKTHKLHSIFFMLPPIHELALANGRLLLVGLVLLTLGLSSGFFIGRPLDMVKVAWSIGAWLVYAAIVGAGRLHRISPRRIAVLSVGAFALLFVTLWGINFVAQTPKSHTASTAP